MNILNNCLKNNYVSMWLKFGEIKNDYEEAFALMLKLGDNMGLKNF